MTAITTLIAVVLAVPGLLTSAHLGTLAVASIFYRDRASRADGGSVRLLVLIPAHNEAPVIASTLTALSRAQRAGDQVLLVADRCTDATADIARSHGASVLERGPDASPGRHAARQAGLDHPRALDWDAVVMIDADSVVEPGFLDVCARAIASGAPAAQARSEGALGGGMVALTTLVAFTLQGVVVPRGRDLLGLCVRLRGTGMVIRRDVALTHRFTAPASEDLVYTLDLLLDGVRPRHLDGARLRSQSVDDWSGLQQQRVRYEAGRMAAARAFVPRLLARPTAARLEAALFLASPPFATAALLLVAAAGVAVAAGNLVLAAVAGAGVAVLVATLVIGLITARVGLRAWSTLLIAPWYLLWKLLVQVRALTAVGRREQHFPPTSRT